MTRLGLGALVLGVALVVVGWLLVWPAFVVLGGAAFVLVVLAFAYVARRPRLAIDRRIQPPRVAKGLPAIAYLHMTNRGRSSVPASIAAQPYGSMTVRTVLPRLSSGQSGIQTYRLPTYRRGVFPIGPLEISRSDPFGFARATQRLTGDDEIWVYPRVLPMRPLPSGVTRNIEGPSSDMAQEGSITFHRLQEYVVGDDLRMVHWKSTAKLGRLVIRHNVDTSQPYTVVLIDVRPSLYSVDTFESAIDATASVVQCSAAGKSPVQLRTSAGARVGGTGATDPPLVLDYLTALEPDERGSLRQELLALRHERGGTALVVVTGVLDPADLPNVAALKRRFQRLIVISVTTDEGPEVRYPGVSVIRARTADDVLAAWNIEVSR
ncbi:MAG TPA: DUF58 domain-containing protein [Acidimicrobiales bacterium]|nr:DUF58 domain-containing protein [Acidimicrobiales bacterium]